MWRKTICPNQVSPPNRDRNVDLASSLILCVRLLISDLSPTGVFFRTVIANQSPMTGAIMNDYIPEVNGKSRAPGSVVATVAPGKKSRLRFINTSAYARFYIYIPNHKMNVIELDGVSMFTGPDTDGIEVASGQRVSVLVTGNQDSTKNYGIVAVMDHRLNSGSLNTNWNNNFPECVWDANATPGGDRAKVEYVVGALSYDVTPTGNPPLSFDSSSPWLTRIPSDDSRPLMRFRPNVVWQTATYDNRGGQRQTVPLFPWAFNETDLKPLAQTAKLTTDQDTNIHFLELIDTPKAPGNQWGSINSNRFVSPEAGNTRGKFPAVEGVPALLRILQRSNNAISTASTYVNAAQTIVMGKDEIHWFVIRGSLGDHPIHMHGHAFQILAHRLNDVTDAQWNDRTNLPSLIKGKVLPYINDYPSMRDTLMVEKYTISVIAIKAGNPGVWGKFSSPFHPLLFRAFPYLPTSYLPSISSLTYLQQCTVTMISMPLPV